MKGWNDLACGIALDAVKCVHLDKGGYKEIDIKRYAKVEKVNSVKVASSATLCTYSLKVMLDPIALSLK